MGLRNIRRLLASFRVSYKYYISFLQNESTKTSKSRGKVTFQNTSECQRLTKIPKTKAQFMYFNEEI